MEYNYSFRLCIVIELIFSHVHGISNINVFQKETLCSQHFEAYHLQFLTEVKKEFVDA